MKYVKILLLSTLLLVSFLWVAGSQPVLAVSTQDTGGGSGNTCQTGSTDPALCSSPCKDAGHCNLTTKYLNPFINKFLAPLAILSVVVGIVWGAVEYTTSGGDAQRVANAKGKIQKALIGLVSFIFLYAFLNWLLPGGLL
jgi:hypothetical protein